METTLIDGIEYVKECDYLAAPFDTPINHILIDMKDGAIIHHETINVSEKEKRNAAARRAGEFGLVWCPAIIPDENHFIEESAPVSEDAWNKIWPYRRPD